MVARDPEQEYLTEDADQMQQYHLQSERLLL